MKNELRSEYRIRPLIAVEFTPDIISFLPTIVFIPWKHRHLGCAILDFHWLAFHLCFGEWMLKKEK